MNSTSAITLKYNTRMVSPGAHSDTRCPSRPPGARSGSPESFPPGVDALDSRATGDDHIPGETGEQREGGGVRTMKAGEDG